MYQCQYWTSKVLKEIHINKSKVNYQFPVLVDLPQRESTTAIPSFEQTQWEIKKEGKEIKATDLPTVICKARQIVDPNTTSLSRSKQVKEAKLVGNLDSSYLLNQRLILREYYDL